MASVSINGKKIEVEEGLTVIQACEAAGVEIPRFCYHEKLEIAGNCRMCLVEVEGVKKPVASCAQAVSDGMKIQTDSPMVKKARNGVMEFLLINHPLDCPICDQGGECDLQEQALYYGRAENRFSECKRSVESKNFGPLIKTFMNRCIHCTRCVRFIEDVAGTNELGAIGRGEGMEITTAIEGSLTSELSGNIIDLCPVGALTSNPFAYKARSWELQNTDSISIFDSIGSNIILQSKGREILRVLPKVNEEINEEWVSDKARFCYDGLKYQRLDRFYRKKGTKLVQCSELDAFNVLQDRLNFSDSENIISICGALTDLETMVAAQEFMNCLNAPNSCESRLNGLQLTSEDTGFYKLNSTLKGIEDSDCILIIGSNTRIEAPILNARIRKAVVKNGATAAVIGNAHQLNFPYKHISENPWAIKQLILGEHYFAKELLSAKKPCIIVGINVFTGEDAEAFKYHLKSLAQKFKVVTEEWNGFNVLPLHASTVGALTLGFHMENFEAKLKNCEVLLAFGADELDPLKIPVETFVAYFGHHGDVMANRADIILPTAAFSEKHSTYINAEGRAQIANYAVNPPSDVVLEEWKMLSKLSTHLGLNFPINSAAALMQLLMKRVPYIKNLGAANGNMVSANKGKLRDFKHDGFSYPIQNFYMTDTISRASKTMAECTRKLLNPAA